MLVGQIRLGKTSNEFDEFVRCDDVEAGDWSGVAEIMFQYVNVAFLIPILAGREIMHFEHTLFNIVFYYNPSTFNT